MYLNNDPGGVIMQFCNDGWSEKDISLVLSLGGGKKYLLQKFQILQTEIFRNTKFVKLAVRYVGV